MKKTSGLSKAQKRVINDLQGDYVLITGNQLRGAIVGSKTFEYHIGSRVFWNLVDKGLIHQQIDRPFNFVLTPAGREIKL